MNRSLEIVAVGRVGLLDGVPPEFAAQMLPSAKAYHAAGFWGIVCVQEIQTPKFTFRHFIFSLTQAISFTLEGPANILQSLLSLQGKYEHKIEDSDAVLMNDKEFLLFSAGSKNSFTTVYQTSFSSLLNTQYGSESYKEYLALFPSFKYDLKRLAAKAQSFLYPAKTVRFTVIDSIKALWFDRYIETLQRKHFELRVESSLFSLLAQTYSPAPAAPYSRIEQETAIAVRYIILENIRIHFTPKELAGRVHCSVGFMKRAFRKVYGIGPFQLLRKTRMELAKQMLLDGKSLKEAAIEVGMKPNNFPKEFLAYFGYTVSSLKKAMR